MAGRPQSATTGLNLLTRARVSDSLHKTTKMNTDKMTETKTNELTKMEKSILNCAIAGWGGCHNPSDTAPDNITEAITLFTGGMLEEYGDLAECEVFAQWMDYWEGKRDPGPAAEMPDWAKETRDDFVECYGEPEDEAEARGQWLFPEGVRWDVLQAEWERLGGDGLRAKAAELRAAEPPESARVFSGWE